MDIRFSVVIPCFNQGGFLSECLESLSRQTSPVFEAIVVDDGSTDTYTIECLQSECSRTDWSMPVKLVTQENRGLSGARNTGIRASSGNWIVTLDCDDQLDFEASKEYADAITRNPNIDLWYSDIERFGLLRLIYRSAVFNPYLQLFHNIPSSQVCVRKAVFESGIEYQEEMRLGYEDWAFVVDACSVGSFRADSIPLPLLKYRSAGSSMLMHSHMNREAIMQQLHARPIYQDESLRIDLKRVHATAILFACPEVADASIGQTFRDWRLLDEASDFGFFIRGRALLVSFEDEAFIAALTADAYLLEKLAYAMETRDSAEEVIWLVAGDAISGSRAPAAQSELAVVGALLLDNFIHRNKGMFADEGSPPLASLVALTSEVRSSTFVLPVESRESVKVPRTRYVDVFADAATSADASTDLPLTGISLIKFGLRETSRGVNKMIRGLAGAELHNRLMGDKPFMKRLRSDIGVGEAAVIEADLIQRSNRPIERPSRNDRPDLRVGGLPRGRVTDVEKSISFLAPPVLRSVFDDRRKLDESKLNAMVYSHEFPMHLSIPTKTGQRRLFVVASGTRDLTEGAIGNFLARRSENSQDFDVLLLTTHRTLAGDDRLSLVKASAVFPVGDLVGALSCELLLDLFRRYRPEALMILNSLPGFEVLPKLKGSGFLDDCRVVTVHQEQDSAAFHQMAAMQYNSLIATYAVSSETLQRDLVQNLYVSPTKIELLSAGDSNSGNRLGQILFD